MLSKIRLRFLISFLRVVILKIRYRKALDINIFRVYISNGSKIKISNGGKIIIKGSRDRVFLSKNTSIHCSGGVLTIGNGVFFNENNHLVCHSRFEIGDDCLFGQNVCFYDSDHEFNDVSKKIREQGYIKGNIIISDDVWIGAGSVITKNTYIGKHSVIGANSVVRGELQSNSIYAGNPTKLIRKINA